MSNKDSGSAFSSGARDSQSDPTKKAQKFASDAFSKAAGAMGDVADKAKEKASSAAGTMADQVKDLLNRQVGNGADMVGHFASAAQSAADDLDDNAPAFAPVVRGLADRIDGFADDIRDQTADQLFNKASDFTRKQPALVFGLAALAGFFAFRTFKSTPSVVSPSIQPASDHRNRMSQSHGS